MADSNGTASTELVQSLVEGGLAALFEDKEICDHFKAGLKEAGCWPPFHIIVFTVLKKLALLGWDFGGQALRTRLFELLARNERLSKWLDRIANICRECEDKTRLKDMMIAHLRGELHQGPAPKIDDATDAQVLAQLYTKQRFDEQNAQLDAIAVALQDLLTEKSGDAIAPYLGWAEGNGATIADSIRYNSGLYDFEGREREIDMLDRFCGDLSMALPGNRFSWLLLTGPGGEGKTRLALEYTTERIGGNWHAGRLSLPDLRQFRHGEWLPARPTLIVIDYPAQGPDSVHALLANLARRHRAFDWPVHVLLLEREAQGQWFDCVFPRSGDGAAIRAHAFVHEGQPLLTGVAVEPLGSEAIVSMMESRFRRAGLVAPGSKLLEWAVSAVDNRRVETDRGPLPRPRPLFAAAVAEVMVAALRRGEAIDTHWVSALDREHVLAEIVRRDRDLHWLPCAGGDRDLLLRHENLVALATLAGGLKRSDLRELTREVADLMPGPGESGDWPLREELIRRMSDYENGRIAPLEPDLLGEYFLLDRLARIDEVEGDTLRRGICAAAFELGGLEAVGSALRTVMDFTLRAEALGWLLPAPNSSLAALEKASGLVIDLTNRLGLRVVSAMDWLISFDSHTLDNDAIALHEAQAAVNVTSYAGTAGDWTRVEAMLERIDGLRAAFPEKVEIALEEAKAAFNVALDAGAAGDWTRAEAMLARIDALRAALPRHAEIALREAQIAVNVTHYAGKVGDLARAEAMLGRIDGVRAAFPGDAEIAFHGAQAAVNVASYAGTAGDWVGVEAMLARIDGLRAAFSDHAEIALEGAKAALNFSIDAGTARDWARVEAIWPRIDELRAAFPEHVEIALREARIAVSVATSAATEGDWAQVETMLARIDGLRAAFPGDAEIALQAAKTAFNVTIGAEEAGDRARVAAMLARIDGLRADFPEDSEIALSEARLAANITIDAGTTGNWARAEAMLGRIDRLRAAFSNQAEIALEEAHAAFNVSSFAIMAGDRMRVEAMLARIYGLRAAFPEDAEIALEEAKAVFNVLGDAGAKGDWGLVEAMFVRFDGLRAAFPKHAEIALHEAQAVVNIAGYAGTEGDTARVEAMLAKIDRLRAAFPEDAEIALQEAKAALNVTSDAGAARDWARVEAIWLRIDGLRAAFPEDAEIALREAKTAVNIANYAAIEGDWARVDAMLARGRTLAASPIGTAADAPLLRLWSHVLRVKIEHGRAIEERLAEELVARLLAGGADDSPERINEMGGALAVIKYLHANGFASTLATFVDALVEQGLDWTLVPDLEPGGDPQD